MKWYVVTKHLYCLFLISFNIGQGMLKTGGLLLYEDCITSDMMIRFVGKAGLQSHHLPLLQILLTKRNGHFRDTDWLTDPPGQCNRTWVMAHAWTTCPECPLFLQHNEPVHQEWSLIYGESWLGKACIAMDDPLEQAAHSIHLHHILQSTIPSIQSLLTYVLGHNHLVCWFYNLNS